MRGDTVLAEADLILPHPRLAERRFVLQPFADVAPELVVPGYGATVAELLARLGREQEGDVERVGWSGQAP